MPRRLILPLAIFAAVLLDLAAIGPALATPSPAPSAVPTISQPVDQAGWAARKKQVVLPNGLTMAFVEAGNPAGEPLLLLHGYTDSSRSFSLMTSYLSDYRLIIPDQRGHGDSDKPDCCYGLSQFADDARLLLDVLGIDRAAVAGHSLGSMVAMTLAANHPDRVTHLALIGSTVLVPVKPGDWLYDSVLGLKAPLESNAEFLKEWEPANQPTPVDPVFASAMRRDFMTIPLHVWRNVMRELGSIPVGRHAADVKAKVLVLSGGKDPLFPAEHHAALLAAFPGASEQVFADLGHNLNWERPALVAAAIHSFLSE